MSPAAQSREESYADSIVFPNVLSAVCCDCLGKHARAAGKSTARTSDCEDFGSRSIVRCPLPILYEARCRILYVLVMRMRRKAYHLADSVGVLGHELYLGGEPNSRSNLFVRGAFCGAQ